MSENKKCIFCGSNEVIYIGGAVMESHCEDCGYWQSYEYAVDIRNMHTAIHELYFAEDEESANQLAEILQSVSETDSGLEWGQLWIDANELIRDKIEINFRDIDTGRIYDWNGNQKVDIVNSQTIDLY